MGKYSEMLLNPADEAEQPKQKYASILEPQEVKETGITSEGLAVGVSTDFPIIRDQAVETPASGVDAAEVATMVEANFVDNPKAQMAIYAADRFPNEPLEQSVKRYKIVDDKVAFTTGEKLADGQFKYYFEKPSGLKGMAEKFIAAIPSHGPEVVLSTALGVGGATVGGTVGNLPGAMGGASLGAGLGAAGGEGYRKTIGNLFFDEPQSVEGNVKDMTKAYLGGAASEFVGVPAGRAFGKLLTRKTVQDIAELDKTQTQSLIDLAKSKGIDLTPAESSGLQSLISRQELLRDLPSSADVIQNFLKLRSSQVQKSVLEMLEELAPRVKSPERGYRGGIEGATAKLEQLELKRGRKSSPIYKKAYTEQKEPVDIDPVIAVLDDWKNIGAKDDLVGGATKEQTDLIDDLMNELRQNPVQDGVQLPPVSKTSLEALHQVKLKIDKKLLALEESPSAKEKFDKAILLDVKEELLNQMKKVSPTYDKARAMHAKHSKPIDEFMKTFASDIGKLDQKKARRVGSILFGSTSSPLEIKAARSMINSIDPKAWNGVVRSYLEEVFNKGMKDSAIGATGNIGGAYRKAVFGSKDARRRLRAALTPSQYAGVKDLMTVLEATGRAFKQQSNTMPRQVAKEAMEAEAEGIVRMADVAATPTKVTGKMLETLRTLSLADYARKQAKLLTDPESMHDLSRLAPILRELSPREKAFFPAISSALGVILRQAIEDDVDE